MTAAQSRSNNYIKWQTTHQPAVFQLDIFLRVLRPALTVLRPAQTPLHTTRFTQWPARIEKIKIILFLYLILYIISVFVCFQTADELYNACRITPMFLSIVHKIVPMFGKICKIVTLFLGQTLTGWDAGKGGDGRWGILGTHGRGAE